MIKPKLLKSKYLLVTLIAFLFASVGLFGMADAASAQPGYRVCYMSMPDGELQYFKRHIDSYHTGTFRTLRCSDFYSRTVPRVYGKNIPDKDSRGNIDDTTCENFTDRVGLNVASGTHKAVDDICDYMDGGSNYDIQGLPEDEAEIYTLETLKTRRPAK